jgi:anti-sigma B factor antagonist
MADNLMLASEDRGDWTVLTVNGEVDLYTAPRLKERLTEITGAGRSHLAVDLQGVEFMDSTGLGVLIGALKRCKEAGGALTLVGPREPVVKVLAITGLDKVFSISGSVEDASAS